MLKVSNKSLLIASIFLGLYFCTVCISHIYLYVTDVFLIVAFLFILIFLLSVFFFYNVIPRINSFHLKHCEKEKNTKILVFLLGFLFSLIVLLIWYKIAYPGYFSGDSENQYAQALSGKYNDWHPVWHTLLYFTLPLNIFSSRAAIVLLQIIYFSLSMGYLLLTICELSNITVTVFCFILIILNPYVTHISMFPWKDVGFAVSGLIALTSTIRLCTIERKTITLWKIIFLSFFMVCATLFRHNGILFTIPLLGCAFFYIEKQKWFKYAICFLLMCILIKFPLYSILNVERPDKRVTETMGLPMTVIGNTIVENLDQMDDEFNSFALSIAPIETWEEYYECGNFNSIKFTDLINTKPIEEKGYIGIFCEMAKCIWVSPKASIKALFSLMDIVYGIENGLEYEIGLFPFDYSEKPLENTLYSCANFVNYSIFRYFRTYGFLIFCLLASLVSKVYFDIKVNWKKCLIVLPILIYDFGTMLLLTGPDARFFYITFLVTPIILVFLFSERNFTVYE